MEKSERKEDMGFVPAYSFEERIRRVIGKNYYETCPKDLKIFADILSRDQGENWKVKDIRA